MDPASIIKEIGGGLAAVVIVAEALVCLILWRALGERDKAIAERDKAIAGLQEARLTDMNAASERALAMADQNRTVALEANKTTITNTASLEASRLMLERCVAFLERRAG